MATNERRKPLMAELFETIRIGSGRIVVVRPKPTVMTLVAVTVAGIEGKRLAVPSVSGPER